MIDLPGQPLAERILRAVVGSPYPPQQLLLHGPPGTPIADAARAVALALVARGASDDGKHVDVEVVRASGALILLKDLEDGLRHLALRSALGGRRVLVIEDAERLREQEGAPRILKTLEEPPPGAHLILTTSRAQDLLATIRSRCLPVPLRPLTRAQVADALRDQGSPSPEAERLARAHGALALVGGPFAIRMREIGVDLAVGALTGGQSGPELVHAAQRAMESFASENPSAELEELRREAARLAGKRGERTAEKRAEEQERRERRRSLTDGWGHALDGMGSLIADTLAAACGASAAARHPEQVAALHEVAIPARARLLERALDDVQRVRATLAVNPTTDLQVEALLTRIADARRGHPWPSRVAGGLPW